MKIILILLAAEVALSYAYEKPVRTKCWTSGNGKPAKWWNEGERIDRGKYWYECRRGELKPLGCFSEDNQRLEIGDTYKKDGYAMTCQLGSDGYLMFEYSGCVAPDGTVYGADETWTDAKNTYYFKCQQNGQFLKMAAEGCVSHDKQRRIPLGDTDDNGEYIYKCTQKASGAISLCSVGCIHDGIHYNVGEQWQDGAYLFYCKSVAGKCTKQVIGCIEGGKKLFDGQRYRKDATVFQCEVRRNRRSHKVVGCVAKENGKMVDKVLGCRWYLKDDHSKIEQTCVKDGDGTKVVTVGCIYRHQGYDRIWLEPGRYTVWNLPKQYKQAVGLACRTTPDGARLDVFDVNNLQTETDGLVYDSPKGK